MPSAFIPSKLGYSAMHLVMQQIHPCGREGDPSSQAQRLFDALRSLDAMGIHTAYARCPEKQGVGLAVYNRLLRAAAFEMIDV